MTADQPLTPATAPPLLPRSITDLSKMIIGGELPDSSIVTAGVDPATGRLTYSVEAKPLPAGVTTPRAGGKRPIHPAGFMVEEPDEDEDDEDMAE